MSTRADRVPWIVVSQQPLGQWCRRCNARETFDQPVPIETFLARGRAFVSAHKACPEPERRQMQGSGLATACQYVDGTPAHPPFYCIWFETTAGLRYAEAICRAHADVRQNRARAQGEVVVAVEDVEVLS